MLSPTSIASPRPVSLRTDLGEIGPATRSKPTSASWRSRLQTPDSESEEALGEACLGHTAHAGFGTKQPSRTGLSALFGGQVLAAGGDEERVELLSTEADARHARRGHAHAQPLTAVGAILLHDA